MSINPQVTTSAVYTTQSASTQVPYLQATETQPEWRDGMSAQEIRDYRTARDASINGYLVRALEERALLPTPRPLQELINPLGEKIARVTDDFGERTLRGVREGHGALDLTAADGSQEASVYAASSGTILYAGRFSDQSGYGVMMLDDNSRIVSYMHFDAGMLAHLRAGQRLEQGQFIAPMGSTGSRVTGPHLHMTVRQLPEASLPQVWQSQAQQAVRRIQHFFTPGEEAVPQPEPTPNPAHNFLSYLPVDPPINGRTYRDEQRIPAASESLLANAAQRGREPSSPVGELVIPTQPLILIGEPVEAAPEGPARTPQATAPASVRDISTPPF